MEHRCSVCGTALGEGAPAIGERSYCDEHYRRLFAHRRGVWIAAFAGILATAVFVAVASLIGYAGVGSGVARLLVAVLMSGFPAAVWISVFYRMDALEPEPKERMLECFLLGALLAGGALMPLFENLLGLSALASGGFLRSVAANVLIVGFLSEYGKYAVIRFTVFRGQKFNERSDGIVYSAAAGLGFAFASNIHYFMSSRAQDLAVAAMTMAVETLGQASFSGIVGFFLASMKFRDVSRWWMPAGIAVAAVSNGIMHILTNSLAREGLDFSPWRSFALAGIFALSVFGTLFWLSRRVARLAFAGFKSGPALPGEKGETE